MQGIIFVFLAFAGFESSAPLAEETHDPRRTVSRAILLATVSIGIFYVFCSYAGIVGWGFKSFSGYVNVANPWATIAARVWGLSNSLSVSPLSIVSSPMPMPTSTQQAASFSLWSDGEVCGTAIEGPMIVTVRFGPHKGYSIPELQYPTPGSAVEKANRKDYYVTTGHSPNLFEAAQNAVHHIIRHLVKHYDLTRHEAYALCSVTVDLRISEIVDAPNWLISAFLPLDIFE